MSIIDGLRQVARVSPLVRERARMATNIVRRRPVTARYHLRDSGLAIHLRHTTPDLATFDQTFNQGHYELPDGVPPLPEAPIAYDLGANVGMFGAWFLERFPRGRVVAWEADPANAEIHQRTVEANRERVAWELHAAAAGTAPGEVRFLTGHFTNSRLAEEGEEGTAVPVEDVLAGAAEADLLKIDIEGAEWDLVADPRFRSLPTRLVAFEFHPDRCPEPDSRAHAEAVLRDAGYEVAVAELDATEGHGMLWGWKTA